MMRIYSGGLLLGLFLSLFSVAGQAQTFTHTFWFTPPAPSSSIARLGDRVFIGPATLNDGAYFPSGAGCPGSFCFNGFSNKDWLAQLNTQHYGGGAGVMQNGNFAQMYVLNDTSATGPSPSTLGVGLPSAAAIFGAQTNGLLTGASVYPIGAVVVNNPTPGQHPAAWGVYVEAHRVSSDAGETFGAEIESRESGNLITGESPFNSLGGSIGLDIGCGAGLSATGQFNCNAVLRLHANPMPWAAGLVFVTGAIAPDARTGLKPAIMMPYDHTEQWWNGQTMTGALYTTATGVLQIVSPLGVVWQPSASGSATASLDGAGNFTAIGSIRGNGYSANGVPGVSCSGSPTASFASSGGIVTHC